MSYSQKLQEINELNETIKKYGKLSDEILKKINYKFRLEWNYTSNSMEGNSLTKQETRSVMVGNITVDKPIKDALEMKGHDEVITDILKLGKVEINISERRIKEIHKAIIHEEDPERQKQAGVWKLQNNYLYNYKNERFDFVPPAEVAERMHLLINQLNDRKQKVKSDIDAVDLAFWFHLEYITIHPFHDGNGRTARILTNIILISLGFPPVFIKENEKSTYYQYLADIQGYGGEPNLFYEFMAGTLIRSMQLVIDAIEGREIEEQDDWEKKLKFLKTELSNREEVKIKKTDEAIMELFDKTVVPLLEYLIQKLGVFEELFTERQMLFGNRTTTRVVRNINMIRDIAYDPHENYQKDISFTYGLYGFKKGGTNTFSIDINLWWDLQEYTYYVFINHSGYRKAMKRLYHHHLTKEEIEAVGEECGKHLYEQIERRLKML